MLLIEAGLRIGGAVWTRRQEARNRASLATNAEYTVLCIGESTTAMYEGHSYPLELAGRRHRALERAIAESPTDVDLLNGLARIHLTRERWNDSRAVLLGTINRGLANDRTWRLLLTHHREVSNGSSGVEGFAAAKQDSLRALEAARGAPAWVRADFYARLAVYERELGDGEAASRYAARSIDLRRREFAETPDEFAGDFGHMTPQGQRLLAENVAHTMLTEVLGLPP